jgi:alanyl-tRNA synthetase
MTTLLYYENPELYEFDAEVVEVTAYKKQPAVVLSRTAFYPEGGGQPADHGRIETTGVIHVAKTGDAVVHVMAEDPSVATGQIVHAVIDRKRRRDYMQQHTGQHILSAALLSVAGLNTVSVHQGEEYTTIEVDGDSISEDLLRKVQEQANDAIEADLPVESVWVDESALPKYTLRRPPKVSGTIRLVQVGDIDCVACGGIHCARTGQVRLVQALSVETIRGNARIAWKIGDRALADYDADRAAVQAIGAELSAQPHELVERVCSRTHQIKDLELEIRRLSNRIHEEVSRRLESSSQETRGLRVITADFDNEPRGFLRGVTEILIQTPRTVVCLVNRTNEMLQWSIGIGSDTEVDFAMLKPLLALIEGKGGGKPPIWQGMGQKPSGIAEFLGEFRRQCG